MKRAVADLKDPAAAASARETEGMTFLQHLGELRRRLLYAVAGLCLVALACFAFAPELFDLLRQPLANLPHQKLIVLSPLELYITYIKLAVLAALFVAAPWILLQVWLFVSPGLYGHEKRWVAPFVVLGSAFFASGGAFAFFIVLPKGFEYLVVAMPETVEAQFSVAIYFELVIKLLLAFGVIFELPLVMWILAAAGVVDPRRFSKLRRYWVIIAFIVAALLTPPDPFTQLLMAVPLLFFFEIGVLGARLLYKRRRA